MSSGDGRGESRPATGEPVTPYALDVDLRCLNCGYNLRGLSGDPLHCPECGFDNPIWDVEIPAEIVHRQMAHMEAGLLLCAVASLLTGLAIGLAWSAAHNPARADMGACAVCSIFVWALLWVGGCLHFRESCRAQSGWLRGLLLYQAMVIICGAAVLGPILGTYAAAERWLPHRDGREAVLALILAVVCAGVVIGIRRALVPWHRRVMATIEPLQRDAATTIVRKTIRERLIAAHRKQR